MSSLQVPSPCPETLERNLCAMRRHTPETARAIEQAAPRAGLELVQTPEGLGGSLDGRTIASRRRPGSEAEALVATIDLEKTGVAAVLGFGLGHHVRLLAYKTAGIGRVLVYEPDAGLLRSVLERVDCSAWLGAGHVRVLTDAEDGGQIARAITGAEGLTAAGVKIVPHPASEERLGEGAGKFGAVLAEVIGAVRTTVLTTLVQSETTLRNELLNAGRYASCPGVASLEGIARGRPAVVVSAGPSLERNVHLLGEPGVRERVVIVATPTVLQPLLRRGIRPHFVCALDWSDISARFYEGLTAEDVEGITLVAEAKVNPAVIDAFPGAIRFPSTPRLDQVLAFSGSPGAARRMGQVVQGSTVAHLCYGLARHLGCDPVILIGQDLGFTDGQYYAAGAAIHTVWSGELGPFQTLEMLEWERIARMGGQLRERKDVLGRPILLDEQMMNYLSFFERMFVDDRERGLRVIDATEGGVAKRGAEVATLEGALGEVAREPHGLEEAMASLREPPAPGVEVLAAALDRVRRDVRRVGKISRETSVLLRRTAALEREPREQARVIERIHRNREEVSALSVAFDFVQFIEQNGALRRMKSDRALMVAEDLDERERNRRRIERDRENVDALAAAADRAAAILSDALRRARGERVATTRRTEPEPAEAGRPRRVGAVVYVDHEIGGLGTPRALDETFLLGRSALRLTVERLLAARSLDAVVLASGEPERTARALGPAASDPRVRIVPTDAAAWRARLRAVGPARLFSPSAWRGGLGGLACYDEAADPRSCAEVAAGARLDAAVIVGADWALVDPALIDAVVERYRAEPERRRVMFSQAPPGLGGMLVDEQTLQRLAANAGAGRFATFGALVSYMPMRPRVDPIGQDFCVRIEPEVRDLGRRCVPDSAPRFAQLADALADAGEGVLRMDALAVARAVAGADKGVPTGAPQHVTLELCTGRLMGGLLGRLRQGGEEPAEREPMPVDLARRIFRQLAEDRSDATVTLFGSGDPLLHPRLGEIVRAAREEGVAAVHIRTDLLHAPGGAFDAAAFLDMGADVISVDLLAMKAETYERIAGCDRFGEVQDRLVALLDERERRREFWAAGSIPTPWIAPRLTRCDDTYEEIERFYDRWNVQAGACVIDPLPRKAEGQRIQPLPLPEPARSRLERTELRVLSDGTVAGAPSIDLRTAPLLDAWRRLRRARRERAALRRPAGRFAVPAGEAREAGREIGREAVRGEPAAVPSVEAPAPAPAAV